MAVTSTPWGKTLTAAADTVIGPLVIKAIFWVADDGSNLDIADTDQFELHDEASGSLIISKQAGTSENGLEIILPKENWIRSEKGVYVTTMGGGILHLWL